MTSHYHEFLQKYDSHYPYETKNRVVVDKNYVDFIYQFVNSARYSQITGPPRTNFPNCNEGRSFISTKSFQISISPWQKEPWLPRGDCIKPQDGSIIHFNYIDLEFLEAVYPIKVSIYEVCSPGCVTQILAQDSDKNWFKLWTAKQPQTVPSTSRIFSPPLQFCDFKTKILRLKFMPLSTKCNYSDCTSLDAVELIGTSKLIFPKNSEQSLTNLLKSINRKYPCHGDIHNLTPDCKNAHMDIFDLQAKFLEYCIICERYCNRGLDIAKNDHKSKLMHKLQEENVILLSSKQEYINHNLLRDPSNFAKLVKKDIKLYWNESKEQPRCSFSALPNEIILKILKNLDIRSLCRMSQLNKHLNNLTWDPSLLTSLNLWDSRYMYSSCIDYIISYLAPRCEYLQQLDLTSSNISSIPHFKDFLDICGKNLTHLRLRNCQFVDNSALLQISKICKNLKVLDLSNCIKTDLANLENLNLTGTFNITAESVCKILQNNRKMRDLNLNGLYRDHQEDMLLDTIAIQLRNSCPDLEVINVAGNNITSLGIDALAECKNLRKLNLSWMNFGNRPFDECAIDKRSLRRLFSSCQLLEEVNLTSLNGDYFEELTLCKNLKKVYLDAPDEENDRSEILRQCPKLQEVYVTKWK